MFFLRKTRVLSNFFKLNKLTHNYYKTVNKNNSIYLIDECNTESASKSTNKYTWRSATCGELNKEHVGNNVTLCGWLEFQRMDKFLILRDGYGQTQLIIDEQNDKVKNLVRSINYEAALQVSGIVKERPVEMINPRQSTGDIEVLIEDLQVLNNPHTKLPFNIREYQKANESLRMQFRYLDLRFSQMQRNLRMRSEIIMKMREYLIRHCDFVDVETPTLFKATPGGAQEFVVPTRQKDKFYSLVQSPQQFKQMLMCGGIDRYFQIARCYRDETSRPDRQPEFTQLDIELSFTTLEGVLRLVEDLLNFSLSEVSEIKGQFPRISYFDALNLYGSDKPDVRFEHKIQDFTDVLDPVLNTFRQKDFYAGCILFNEPFDKIKLKKDGNHWPETRMHQIKYENLDDFVKKLTRIVPDTKIVGKFYEMLDFKGKCSLFLVHGDRKQALQRLGRLRLDCADFLESQNIEIRQKGLHFLWILDFPLFSADENGQLCSEHHPFTAPFSEDIKLIDLDPFKMRAMSYDLVLNGNEVGGGSIRIHDAELQRKVLQMLGIKGLDHIVEMLSYGCPPHGGIALGLDRLMASILETSSIRDVIAFPKTFEGKDPVSGAPSVITKETRKLYNLN